MKYTVLMGFLAERELNKIDHYISNDLMAPIAAQRIVAEIKAAVLSLDEMPYRYPEVDAEIIGIPGIRKCVIENYIAFYRVRESDKTVHILRLLYGMRDWQTFLRDTSD